MRDAHHETNDGSDRNGRDHSAAAARSAGADRDLALSDPYKWWREARSNIEQGLAVPAVTEAPQCGRFALRRHKDGPLLPAAIWMEGKLLRAAVGRDLVDPETIWLSCARRPVDEKDYKNRMEQGMWPGDSPSSVTPSVGHNRGAEPTLAEEIDNAIAAASEWLARTPIEDQAAADIADGWKRRLIELKDKAAAAHAARKAPILKAAREADAEYKPLIERCEAALRAVRSPLGAYLAAVEGKARAAAERARKAIEKAAARIKNPEQAAAMLATPVVAPKVKAGTGSMGAKTGLKTETHYRVVDHAAALAYFADHPDMHEFVAKLAARVARTGIAVPGVEVIKERIAT